MVSIGSLHLFIEIVSETHAAFCTTNNRNNSLKTRDLCLFWINKVSLNNNRLICVVSWKISRVFNIVIIKIPNRTTSIIYRVLPKEIP